MNKSHDCKMAASLTKRKKILLIILLMRLRRKRLERRPRSLWVRPWIVRRANQGVFGNLIQELRSEDQDMYRRYFRLTPEEFQFILNKVSPLISKSDTNMRKSIPAEERLAVTLRFLATGETFHSLAFSYRMGERTISGIVTETCKALFDCLRGDYMKVPSTEQEWLQVSNEFEQKWNYPYCLGAIDGKHFSLREPANSGSEFFNYKHFFSILMLALVDANYRFLFVDVGSTGRAGDAGVFHRSTLKEAMDTNALNFPGSGAIEGEECKYHIIGDDAFPLRCDIMKPYPHRNMSMDQRIFNYRLSRARRVVENAFGILANRFRVFLTTMCLTAEKTEAVVLAACCLHNFLLTNKPTPVGMVDQEDSSHNIIPGNWREDNLMFKNIQPTRSNNFSNSAKGQRERLKHFFNDICPLPWQDKMV